MRFGLFFIASDRTRAAALPVCRNSAGDSKAPPQGIGNRTAKTEQFVLLWLFLQVFRPNDKIEPTDLQAVIACTLRHCDAQVRVAPVGCLMLWGKFFSMEPSEQKGDNFNAA